MPQSSYEVTVPGNNSDEHLESEWREGNDLINVKLFETHYECFWYTDITRHDFVDFFSERNQYMSGGEPQWQVIRVITQDLEPVKEVQLADLLGQTELANYKQIEVEQDKIRSYWKEESVTRPGLDDLGQRIHVSGPPRYFEPLSYLYGQFAPERMDEETRQEVINAVIEYLHKNSN